jgi:hypothetical protein
MILEEMKRKMVNVFLGNHEPKHVYHKEIQVYEETPSKKKVGDWFGEESRNQTCISNMTKAVENAN